MYIFLDENNIVYDMTVALPPYYSGKRYVIVEDDVVCGLGMCYVDGEFITPNIEPTEEEIFQAELLLNQVTIMNTQAEQDEVLAEILLNQMEV